VPDALKTMLETQMRQSVRALEIAADVSALKTMIQTFLSPEQRVFLAELLSENRRKCQPLIDQERRLFQQMVAALSAMPGDVSKKSN
jgi:hypothetical protein